ncbi:hypothetical protein GCM10011491_42460 [Brucella endophytica]|uniref:Uncharacterized protein n=1 Tax=Brucella endophytica TaxID=1963359 RepID=A0A916SPG2_9HYPH|nr:hypothetical protein GCM10011491_42460 [Brucella endophytica]
MFVSAADAGKEGVRAVDFNQSFPFDQPETIADIAHEAAVMENDQAGRFVAQKFDFKRFLPSMWRWFVGSSRM